MRSNRPQSFPKLPLRVVLIVPFVLQIFAVVGLTGWLSLRNGQKTVNDLATQLQKEVIAGISIHLDNYLVTPHEINQINADAIDLGLLDLQDFQKTGHYFWKQMQVHKNISYIYYVLATGEYAGAGYFLNPDKVTIDELSANTNWQADTYDTDSEGNRTALVASYDDYDPQEEAAYTDAIRAGKPVWSQVYHWDNFPNILSVSASYPIYQSDRQLLGVLVTTLRLSQISDFLRQLEMSPSSKTLIIERNGLIIGSSSEEKPYILTNGEAKRINVLDSNDSLLQAAGKHLQEIFGDFSQIEGNQQLEFKLAGDRHFVQVTPWKDEFGLDWLAIAILPESDFMTQIHANTRSTILLCLLALAVATASGIFTSYWLSRPILYLTQVSREMSRGKLEQTIEMRENIQEIDSLAQSFNQMAIQLKDSFYTLEKAKDVLEIRVRERTAELTQTLEKLQSTQTQLIQTEKMSSLGQLVAGVAHEINNPVNFIYGNLIHVDDYARDLLEVLDAYQQHSPNTVPEVETLIEELDVDFLAEDLPKVIDSMKIGAQRIREIVNSLRNFSRLDEAAIKEVDIHEGIESTLLLLSHRLNLFSETSEIKIVRDYSKLPRVECYPGQLNQVFMNILSNAIDVLQEKGAGGGDRYPQITIRTETTVNRQVIIRIADNGKGISEALQKRIFDPFFTTKPVGKGTGLGLAISYQIVVERHQGQLNCISTPGKGTEFAIAIPQRQSSSGI